MRVMKRYPSSASLKKTQENYPSSMAPDREWRKSATESGLYCTWEAMGARSRVRRVPWHPRQPYELGHFIAAAPVRTVHYKTAMAVRPFLRSDMLAA
jgi:hypothetical protein